MDTRRKTRSASKIKEVKPKEAKSKTSKSKPKPAKKEKSVAKKNKKTSKEIKEETKEPVTLRKQSSSRKSAEPKIDKKVSTTSVSKRSTRSQNKQEVKVEKQKETKSKTKSKSKEKISKTKTKKSSTTKPNIETKATKETVKLTKKKSSRSSQRSKTQRKHSKKEEIKTVKIQEDVQMEPEESPKFSKDQKKRSNSVKEEKPSLSFEPSHRGGNAPDISNLLKLVNALGGESQQRSSTRFVPTKPHKFKPNFGNTKYKPHPKPSVKEIKEVKKIKEEKEDVVMAEDNHIKKPKEKHKPKDLFPKAEIALGGCTQNNNIDDQPMIDEEQVDQDDPSNLWVKTSDINKYPPVTRKMKNIGTFLEKDQEEELEDSQQQSNQVKLLKKDSQFKADQIEENGGNQPIFNIEKEELGNVEFKENEFYFIQLPQILNMLGQSRIQERNTLRRIPPGKIGKLRIHKSGKISLKLAPAESEIKEEEDQNMSYNKDVVYNLNHGVKQTFYNELAQIENGSITFLPSISNKVVMTPDIESML